MTVSGLSVVVTNVRLNTGNPARPWATAVGIRDGKLAVVGAAAEILKMAAPGTQIIDARGQPLTLPAGIVIGSSVAVSVAGDGRVTLDSEAR